MIEKLNFNEEWKVINGYEKYEVWNKGKIKNLKTGRILKPCLNSSNYYMLNLYNINGMKTVYIHKLVSEHFINNPENKKYVDHIDNNKSNNFFTNLRWVSQTENLMNRNKWKNLKSWMYKGVIFDNKCKNKWRWWITHDKKLIIIGRYNDEKEAAKWYNLKAFELYKEYALLNCID
jgi:hypothetical protein